MFDLVTPSRTYYIQVSTPQLMHGTVGDHNPIPPIEFIPINAVVLASDMSSVAIKHPKCP